MSNNPSAYDRLMNAGYEYEGGEDLHDLYRDLRSEILQQVVLELKTGDDSGLVCAHAVETIKQMITEGRGE